jgi:predicted enzyme related to lactoylglutathione lyase
MATKFWHIGLTVEDLDSSIAQYEALGLNLENRFDKDTPQAMAAILLGPNGAGVELWQWLEPDHPQVEHIRQHIAFKSDNHEDDVAQLEAQGCQVVIPKTVGKLVTYTFLVDQNGQNIEIASTTKDAIDYHRLLGLGFVENPETAHGGGEDGYVITRQSIDNLCINLGDRAESQRIHGPLTRHFDEFHRYKHSCDCPLEGEHLPQQTATFDAESVEKLADLLTREPNALQTKRVGPLAVEAITGYVDILRKFSKESAI